MTITNWLSKVIHTIKRPAFSKTTEPTIIPRNKHNVSRQLISKNALNILYRLNRFNYDAYLVGGGIRDILAGQKPKDFDVVTNAQPDQLKSIFRNCRLIGRRFRLAHIFFGDEIIEVATFRATPQKHNSKQHAKDDSGLILRDNVYGTIEEDVWRRDFTINALYYNINDFTIVDYVGGVKDIKHKIIRIIGDPQQRYQEDPARLIRAIRFASKLNFKIERHTAAPLKTMTHLLKQIPPARLFEETIKLFHTGHAYQSFKQLQQYGLFAYLFPQTHKALNSSEESENTKLLIKYALRDSDKRIASDKSLSPAFLFAVMLWPVLQHHMKHWQNKGLKLFPAFHRASHDVLNQQIEHTMIPRRISHSIQNIWLLQYHFRHRHSKKVWHTLHHQRFRAGYDLLLLRAEAGERVKSQADWWTRFLNANHKMRQEMIKRH